MISNEAIEQFLAGHRVAVIGASDEKSNFGGAIHRELAAHGFDVVAVHPSATTVAGGPCYPSLDEVPGTLDGVMVVVPADRAIAAVEACVRREVPVVWLFQGLGGKGAVSDEAIRLCHDNGIAVVEGACPLMFLEPVAWFHRVHRFARRHRGELAKAS